MLLVLVGTYFAAYSEGVSRYVLERQARKARFSFDDSDVRFGRFYIVALGLVLTLIGLLGLFGTPPRG